METNEEGLIRAVLAMSARYTVPIETKRSDSLIATKRYTLPYEKTNVADSNTHSAKDRSVIPYKPVSL